MPTAIGQETYQALLQRCFHPFHKAVGELADRVLPRRNQKDPLYHLDLHSMPSLGTKEHRDPGEQRADLVISNQDGKSSSQKFFDLVIEAGKKEGFRVAANWPYKGGRITETYGHPENGWETVQIELNRRLYMNEETKRPISGQFEKTQTRVGHVLRNIAQSL